MELYGSSFHANSPESWLILTIYAGFWLYSYYSLVIFLIHLRQENKSVDNIELEEN